MKRISLLQAFIPILCLVILLAFNVYVYGDNALSGSNQFILLVGAAVAALVGFWNKIPFEEMLDAVAGNLKSTSTAILILLFVGSLSGTWLLSGVIPTMIYYGLDLLNPTIFLFASVIISAVISIATGSSWTTSATVGIALIGIGKAIGLEPGMIAGAVISGAYFGDKMSPLSDTTNLAAAMAGTELITHIRYMFFTTIPSVIITLIIFLIIGFGIQANGVANPADMQASITSSFTITPWLLLVPLIVIGLIILKTKPLIALFVGTLLGGVFALLFQSQIIWSNGMRYAIEKEVPLEYADMLEDNFTGYNYYAPGEYEIKSKTKELIANVGFELPKVSEKPNEPIERLAGIFKDGKKVGDIKIKATPTSYLTSAYFAIMDAIATGTSVENSNAELADLFVAKGMKGMLGTIWLIICAMVFGGILESIGALTRISEFFLKIAKGVLGLFVSTMATCIGLNITASDQYLAIVVPGKMFAKAYEEKGLAPENLSRTLEDSGTVTSVLIPWNTCGAYQAGVLGVDTLSYAGYAFFNYISPCMTLIFAAFGIKIRMLVNKTK